MSTPWNLPFGIAVPSADVQSGCAAGVPGAQPQALQPRSSGGVRDHARVRPLCASGQQGLCSRHRPLPLGLVDPVVLTETVKLRLLFSVGM